MITLAESTPQSVPIADKAFGRVLPFIWGIVPAVIVMMLAALAPVPLGELTRDQSALVFELKSWAPYYGLISDIGISLFFVTAGVMLISLIMCWEIEGDRRLRIFMLLGCCLAAALAIDDMFQFHESVPDMLEALGWPHATSHRGEKIVYLCYAIAALTYVGVYRDQARRLGGFPLLLTAGFFFAISVSVDGYFYHFFNWRAGGEVWLEDGSKLIGVNSWFVAHIMMCRTLLQHMGAGRRKPSIAAAR